MPQHIPRKQLKKDEVRDTLAQGADAVLSHQQLTLYIVIIAVIAAVGVFGWKTYTERQTVKASAGFDAAMTVFQAPVGTPPTPGEPSYSSDNQKYTLAALPVCRRRVEISANARGPARTLLRCAGLRKSGQDG